jgi:hypothetical protein
MDMSTSSGFVDYFILEAGEYVEELDGLLSKGGISGPMPDVDGVQRVARALRGTATMAKLLPFADLAAMVERIGRGLHVGTVKWDPTLAGAVTAAVDDLKLLLRAARTWSSEDDRRAAERINELSRYAPTQSATSSADAPRTRGPVTSFLATEAANIAAGLELLTTRPADATTAGNVLGRVRALRGVAGVREISALSDVLEATEEAARPLELHGESLPAEANTLLHAAADLLRHLAATLRSGGDANAPNSQLERFVEAQDRWAEREEERDRIVPIANLFYTDGSAGVVESAAHPPTTMSERFRLELVSQGEHLRAIIDTARETPGGAASRTRREVRRALHSLEATAESFGEPEVGAAIRAIGSVVEQGDEQGLATLERIASVLTQPTADGPTLAGLLRGALQEPGHETELRVAPSPVPESTKAHEPVVSHPPRTEPAARQLADKPPAAPAWPTTPNAFLPALDSGIAALDDLSLRPMSMPVPTADEALVPIEDLLYRGRAALDRALEIRDQLRRTGATSDPEALEELFDLVELARAE